MRNAAPRVDCDPTTTTYPDHKGNEVFVVVLGAAAKDVQTLVVTRATQLSDGKLHPVNKEAEMCVNGSAVAGARMTCIISVQYSRHGAVAVALDALEKSRWSHLFAQIVVGVRDQPVIAVDQ